MCIPYQELFTVKHLLLDCTDFRITRSRFFRINVGWSGGAKVLGKLPVPGRPTNLDYSRLVGCFGFNALSDSISVYIGPSPKEREKEERKDR